MSESASSTASLYHGDFIDLTDEVENQKQPIDQKNDIPLCKNSGLESFEAAQLLKVSDGVIQRNCSIFSADQTQNLQKMQRIELAIPAKGNQHTLKPAISQRPKINIQENIVLTPVKTPPIKKLTVNSKQVNTESTAVTKCALSKSQLSETNFKSSGEQILNVEREKAPINPGTILYPTNHKNVFLLLTKQSLPEKNKEIADKPQPTRFLPAFDKDDIQNKLINPSTSERPGEILENRGNKMKCVGLSHTFNKHDCLMSNQTVKKTFSNDANENSSDDDVIIVSQKPHKISPKGGLKAQTSNTVTPGAITRPNEVPEKILTTSPNLHKKVAEKKTYAENTQTLESKNTVLNPFCLKQSSSMIASPEKLKFVKPKEITSTLNSNNNVVLPVQSQRKTQNINMKSVSVLSQDRAKVRSKHFTNVKKFIPPLKMRLPSSTRIATETAVKSLNKSSEMKIQTLKKMDKTIEIPVPKSQTLADFVETASAVATITPENIKHSGPAYKYAVVYHLNPDGSTAENSIGLHEQDEVVELSPTEQCFEEIEQQKEAQQDSGDESTIFATPLSPIPLEDDFFAEEYTDNFETQHSAQVTPVDITAIINQGRKRDYPCRCGSVPIKDQNSVLKGFLRKEMKRPACVTELSRFVKKQEKTIAVMKKRVAKYDSNFVVCRDYSNNFLPEEETLPTISEVITRVNEEVRQIKKQEDKRTKEDLKLQLATPEEALKLIKKGLELIQRWSLETNFERDKKDTEPKKSIDNIVPVIEIKGDPPPPVQKKRGSNRKLRPVDTIELSNKTIGHNDVRGESVPVLKKRGRPFKNPKEDNNAKNVDVPLKKKRGRSFKDAKDGRVPMAEKVTDSKITGVPIAKKRNKKVDQDKIQVTKRRRKQVLREKPDPVPDEEIVGESDKGLTKNGKVVRKRRRRKAGTLDLKIVSIESLAHEHEIEVGPRLVQEKITKVIDLSNDSDEDLLVVKRVDILNTVGNSSRGRKSNLYK